MSSNPLAGATFITRGELHDMVQQSIANEPNERKRLMAAQYEFHSRTKDATIKQKFLIFKEVAAKYGYREEWFIDKINM